MDFKSESSFHILFWLYSNNHQNAAKSILFNLKNAGIEHLFVDLFLCMQAKLDGDIDEAKYRFERLIKECRNEGSKNVFINWYENSMVLNDFLPLIKGSIGEDQNLIENLNVIKDIGLDASIAPLVGDAVVAILKNAKEGSCEQRLALAESKIYFSNHDLKAYKEAEECLRILLTEIPENPNVSYSLGHALMNQGHTDQAIEFFEKAIEINPSRYYYIKRYCIAVSELADFEKLKDIAEKSLKFFPNNENLKDILNNANRMLDQGSEKSRIISKFPDHIDKLKDLKEAAEKYVFNFEVDSDFLIKEDSRILTLGSCFAENISKALIKRGMNAENITFGEAINSTYANLCYLKRVSGGAIDSNTKAILSILKRDPVQDLEKFKNFEFVVFTLGVAPCAFNQKGEFEMIHPTQFSLRKSLNEFTWRTTTVEENIRNIKEIIKVFYEIQPNIKMIFTVSPIPLKVSFEYSSAILADCVSKSTLIASVDQVIKESENKLMYWPSFELFRWLGVYSESNVFGEDDQSSRHASQFAVDIVVDNFYNKFFK